MISKRVKPLSENLKRAIEATSILGAPVLVTYAGSPVSWHFYGQFSSDPGNPGDRSVELVGRFKEMWTPVIRFAEEKGVTIALDCAVRMGNIACNPEMWERILDAIPLRQSRVIVRSLPLALDGDFAGRRCYPYVFRQVVLC